jgi:hypothetical protein
VRGFISPQFDVMNTPTSLVSTWKGVSQMEFLVFLILLVLLDLAAMRWGVISIDGPDSAEWLRRQLWYGFH